MATGYLLRKASPMARTRVIRSEVLNFPWTGGGALSPAIGPDGRVYAMALNTLFIFPPPPPGHGFVHPRPISFS